jgi:hypothetical protein
MTPGQVANLVAAALKGAKGVTVIDVKSRGLLIEADGTKMMIGIQETS